MYKEVAMMLWYINMPTPYVFKSRICCLKISLLIHSIIILRLYEAILKIKLLVDNPGYKVVSV